MVMLSKKNQFKYVILEKNGITSSPYLHEYTQAYLFWKKTWKTIFNDVGSPEAFLIDDFYRQDLIPAIIFRNQVIACHLSTVFDFKNPVVKEMRYFSIFDGALDWVQRNSAEKVLSIEFLAVHPNWRNQGKGFSFAETLISLAFELMKQKQIGAAVGVTVKAAKVDEMARDLSCAVLSKGVKRGNLICDIMGQTLDNVHPPRSRQVVEFVEYLWSHHENSNRFKHLRKVA